MSDDLVLGKGSAVTISNDIGNITLDAASNIVQVASGDTLTVDILNYSASGRETLTNESRKAVYISGATATDKYVVTVQGDGTTFVSVQAEAKTDSLIIHTSAAYTGDVCWIRLK